MIPYIFPAGTTDFSTFGLGGAGGAISCTVQEELNGMFELEMEYPQDGEMLSYLKVENYIVVEIDGLAERQVFRIYRVTESLNNMVKLFAKHKSYELLDVPVVPVDIVEKTVAEAWGTIVSNVVEPIGYVFATDISKAVSLNLRGESMKEALKLLQEAAKGELKWDGNNIHLLANRGETNTNVMQYGKNIIDLENEINMERVYTHIFPYALQTNDETITKKVILTEKVIPVPNALPLARKIILPVDLSSEINMDGSNLENQLRNAATKYLEENSGIGTIKQSITVDIFDQRSACAEPVQGDLVYIRLGDYMGVHVPGMDLDVTLQVVSTSYNVLLDRYEELEIGTPVKTIADRF